MRKIPPYIRMDTEAFLQAIEQNSRKSVAIFKKFREILFHLLNDEPNEFDETTTEGRMLKRFADTAKTGLQTYWKHIESLPSNEDSKGNPNGEPDDNITEHKQKKEIKEKEKRAEVKYGIRI